jgi:ribosomal protein S4
MGLFPSYTNVAKAMHKKHIRVNAIININPNYLVKAGDVVTVDKAA